MYFILVNQPNPTVYEGDNLSAGSVCSEADLKIPPHPKIPPAELQLSYSFTNVFNQHLHRAASCIHVINTMRDLLFPCHTDSGGAPAVSASPARHCVRACGRVCVCVHALTCAAQATHWRASSVITHTLTADYFLQRTRRESIKRSMKRGGRVIQKADCVSQLIPCSRVLLRSQTLKNWCSIAERSTTHGTLEECFHKARSILLVPHDQLVL